VESSKKKEELLAELDSEISSLDHLIHLATPASARLSSNNSIYYSGLAADVERIKRFV